MQDIIFALVSFLIAAFAFGFGAYKLFRKKKPLYFQLFICAAGCFALKQLSTVINLWCDVSQDVSIGMLGIFGCNFFLLSANYGTLDKIVDDGKDSKKAKIMALIAPVIMAIFTVFAFLSWKDRDMFCAIVWIIMLLPSLLASYFNLKHILLPMDPFEFLRATKPCNIASLCFYTITATYVITLAIANSLISGILSILMSLSVLGLTIGAVKGLNKWGI